MGDFEDRARAEGNWPKEELREAAEEWRAIPDSQKRHIPPLKRITEESR